jgi:hypothetical protein
MTRAVSDKKKVHYVHERIHDALYESLDKRWGDVLMEWDAASPKQREMVKNHVSGLRNRAWRTLKEIRSVDGLEKALTLQYIELKARWTTLNMQIQGQTAKQGAPDEELVYRATCVSLIIEALEPLLREERVDTLTDRLNATVLERE